MKYYKLRLLEDINSEDKFVNEINNQLNLSYNNSYNEEAFFVQWFFMHTVI